MNAVLGQCEDGMGVRARNFRWTSMPGATAAIAVGRADAPRARTQLTPGALRASTPLSGGQAFHASSVMESRRASIWWAKQSGHQARVPAKVWAGRNRGL